MPMDMSIALLAAQRQDIHPLRLDRAPDCLAHFIDCSLKLEIFPQSEISRHLFFMYRGCNKRVPNLGGIFIQEGDELTVLVNHVIAVQSTRDHLTNKTWTMLNLIDVRIQIESFTIVHLLFLRTRQRGRDSKPNVDQARKILAAFLKILVAFDPSRQRTCQQGIHAIGDDRQADKDRA